MISVIVPVYNVEQYLPRCIDSILAQTYSDFELLLIDDGSKDSSGAICDEYAGRDERIRVFHKENGGLSDARNFGLDRMQGEYITFIDSDDYIGCEYLRILMDMMENSHADMTAVGIESTHALDLEYSESEDKRITFIGEAVLREILCGKLITCSSCAKLYQKQLFQNVRFPIGKIYEDLLTIPYLVNKDSRCVCSSSVQYYYYFREGSIMNSVSDDAIETWLFGMNKLINHIKENYPQIEKYAEYMLVKHVFWKAVDWKLYSQDYIALARNIKREYRNSFRKASLLPNLTLKERIKATIFFINVRLYRFVRVGWIRMVDNPDSRHFIRESAQAKQE